jgi:hypothetical protein
MGNENDGVREDRLSSLGRSSTQSYTLEQQREIRRGLDVQNIPGTGTPIRSCRWAREQLRGPGSATKPVPGNYSRCLHCTEPDQVVIGRSQSRLH